MSGVSRISLSERAIAHRDARCNSLNTPDSRRRFTSRRNQGNKSKREGRTTRLGSSTSFVCVASESWYNFLNTVGPVSAAVSLSLSLSDSLSLSFWGDSPLLPHSTGSHRQQRNSSRRRPHIFSQVQVRRVCPRETRCCLDRRVRLEIASSIYLSIRSADVRNY